MPVRHEYFNTVQIHEFSFMLCAIEKHSIINAFSMDWVTGHVLAWVISLCMICLCNFPEECPSSGNLKRRTVTGQFSWAVVLVPHMPSQSHVVSDLALLFVHSSHVASYASIHFLVWLLLRIQGLLAMQFPKHVFQVLQIVVLSNWVVFPGNRYFRL